MGNLLLQARIRHVLSEEGIERMQTHVFIVNDDTFPSHLRYLFAGTGAKEKDKDVSLLADIKRVRPGDYVIFISKEPLK